jgi:hypothetical protein
LGTYGSVGGPARKRRADPAAEAAACRPAVVTLNIFEWV